MLKQSSAIADGPPNVKVFASLKKDPRLRWYAKTKSVYSVENASMLGSPTS